MQDLYIIRNECGTEFEVGTGLVTLARALLVRREIRVTDDPLELLKVEDGEPRELTTEEILDLMSILDLLDSEPAEYRRA